MFRVKIDLGAMRHHELKKTEAKEVGAGAQNRLGDWAEELAKPHPHLTKEDLCQTFHEKFHDGCNRSGKNVA